MSKTYQAHSKHYSNLLTVATINEVAKCWDRTWSGVHYHIMADHIAAVQTDDDRWLVSVPSVLAFWGEPTSPTGRFLDWNGAKSALQIRIENHGDRDGSETWQAHCLDASLPGLRSCVPRKTEGRGNVYTGLPTETLSQTPAPKKSRPPRKMRTITASPAAYRVRCRPRRI